MAKTVRFLACFTAFLLAAGFLMAQTPQQFVYQAVARNASNQLIVSSQVSVQVSILKESAEGEVLYKESHSPKTNENGLFTVFVGKGTNATGSFSAITWNNGVFYLKAEVDVNNDGTYDQTSTQQLISVAYSLYATHSSEGLKEILSRNNSGDCDNLTQIKNIAPPTDKNDAVTKGYLDDIVKQIIEKNTGCKSAKAEIASLDATDKDCGKRLTVKLGSTSGTISYKWYKDNQVIPGETDAKLDATVSGTYKVEVTATCDKATPTTNTVSESKAVTASGPTINLANIKYSGKHSGSAINSSGTSVTVDQNSSLTLTANLTENPAVTYSYSWTPSGTGTSITPSTATAGDKTTYTLNVSAEDENGCKSEESKSIEVTVEAVADCPKKSDITPSLKITTTNSSNMVYALKQASTTTCKKSCDWTLTASYTMSKSYPGATATYQWVVFSSSKFWSQSYNDYCGVTKAATTSNSVTGTSMAGASGVKHFAVKVTISVPNCPAVESDPVWQSPNVSQCY